MDPFTFFLPDQDIWNFSNVSFPERDNVQVQVRILIGYLISMFNTFQIPINSAY